MKQIILLSPILSKIPFSGTISFIRTIYFIETIYFTRLFLGSYMQEESPEGGRFKKEVVVDGQSYLLLIRDEGGPPELQVRILLLRLLNEF